MNATRPDIEYRFNASTAAQQCPLCGAEFEPRIGMWPFVAGTASAVCGGPECPMGEEIPGPAPCDTLFEFAQLAPRTLQAIGATEGSGVPVAERLRRVAMNEAVPEEDRALLQLAAIDLQYCEADGTRIRQLEPTLVVQTCGEAAAEMLLSGCGDILS